MSNETTVNATLVGTDPVTGLKNIYAFFKDVEALQNKHQEHYIVLIGIANFEELNEMGGYDFGNKILAEFGKMFRKMTVTAGQLYRMEGSRFALVTSKMIPKDIDMVYRDAQLKVRKDFYVDEKRTSLHLCAGMVFSYNFAADAQTIFSCLRAAITESKNNRQGKLYLINSEKENKNRELLVKINAIRENVIDGCKNFVVDYQPVAYDDGTLAGARAVAKWKTKEFGTVALEGKIGLFQNDPMFYELGEWVIDKAMADGVEFIAKDPYFRLFIDLPSPQAERPEFLNDTLAALNKSGFPADHLTFIVTGYISASNMKKVKKDLDTLAAHGVRFEVADIGKLLSVQSIYEVMPFSDYICKDINKVIGATELIKVLRDDSMIDAAGKKITKEVSSRKFKAVKKNAVHASIEIQYHGVSKTGEELVEQAKYVWSQIWNKDIAQINDIKVYVKPEENMAYYVVNGSDSGRFGL